MKNIIVGSITAFVIAIMVFMATDDAVYQGGNHAKVIEDFGDTMGAGAATVVIDEKSDREKENDKISALRDKAGNMSNFDVSDEYKSKCSSCHGVDGSGMQNGKKMMGPKIFGQSEEKLFKDLVDFKAGRKENIIMKGLLMKLDEEALRRFAKEIGEFQARDAASKK